MSDQCDNNPYPLCPDISKYTEMVKIGEGSYGVVYKVKDKKTGKPVALKKVADNNSEGFPIKALREIKILKSLSHVNVVNIIEVCKSLPTVPATLPKFYIALEFCEHDLSGLLHNNEITFSAAHVKNLMHQLLLGLGYIHANNVLHRDLKPGNLLITSDGTLKITDFGLSRCYNANDQEARYTNLVATRGYIAPEILLGDKNYTAAIDMWSVGCIMVQMLTRLRIFDASSEIKQIKAIVSYCGSIDVDVWPSVANLSIFKAISMDKGLPRILKQRLDPPISDPITLDIIDNILQLDPAKRLTTTQALAHEYFSSNPLPEGIDTILSQITESHLRYFVKARNTRKNEAFIKSKY